MIKTALRRVGAIPQDGQLRLIDIFWLTWLGVTLGMFLPVEFWALLNNHLDTLSDTTWKWENLNFAEPYNVTLWTAAHWAIGVFMFVFTITLVVGAIRRRRGRPAADDALAWVSAAVLFVIITFTIYGSAITGHDGWNVRYWTGWLIWTFGASMPVVAWAFLSGNPQDDLAETMWRWTGADGGPQPWYRHLARVLLAVFLTWLTIHLTFGQLR